MPPKPPPPPRSLALTLLRTVQGWPQKELAAALGCAPSLLSDYEAGRKPVQRERLEEIAAVLGLPPESVDRALSFILGIQALAAPQGTPAAEEARTEAVVARVKAAAETFARELLAVGDARRAEEDRRKARDLWQRMERASPARRRLLVERTMEFRSWALCELVCELSIQAAADDAERALNLADLAVRIADVLPGTEAWRQRVQGYAWAHLANARRVAGQLPAAEEAFERALAFWEAGSSTGFGLLGEARILSLQASLRTDQRRLSEAAILIDRALNLVVSEERSKLLLQKDYVLTLAGDFDGALGVLQEATPLISPTDKPRLYLSLRFKTLNNLLLAGRPEEAESLLPDVQGLAYRLGNSLDSLRLRWLEGRLAAKLGRREEALSVLASVRDEFDNRKIAYDTALATLELAALYLEEGRSGDVRGIARRLYWIFRDQQVHREAVAALQLFCWAVERDTITLTMVVELVAYLRSFRFVLGVRFEFGDSEREPPPRSTTGGGDEQG